MIRATITLLLLPAAAFALIREPEVQAQGRTKDGDLIQVIAVPSGHVEGLADNEPSISFDLPKHLRFELRITGKKATPLPWKGRGTDYDYMPEFQFVDGGRLVVIDWNRGLKNKVLGTVAPGGSFVISEFNLSDHKSNKLLKIKWGKSELIADIRASPDLRFISWGTTKGLVVADLKTGTRKTFATEERARFPCFSPDGSRIAAFFLKNTDIGKIPENQYTVGRVYDSITGSVLADYPRWHQEREGINGGFADVAYKLAWGDHQYWESDNCHTLLEKQLRETPH